MDHTTSRGVDRFLVTDIMKPAVFRLLFYYTAKLPDKLVVPLLKFTKEVDYQEWGREVTGRPRDNMFVCVDNM